jgi:DNA-directed RNA polymerase subunit beta
VREEDDNLLRAAEELGIDLSGVRAGENGGADEQTETEDDTDVGPPTPDAEGDDDIDAAGPDDDDVEGVPDIDIDGNVDIADLTEDR